MSIKHSFFIPDETYCFDKEGLMQYLKEKIFEDGICIHCNNKGMKDFTNVNSL